MYFIESDYFHFQLGSKPFLAKIFFLNERKTNYDYNTFKTFPELLFRKSESKISDYRLTGVNNNNTFFLSFLVYALHNLVIFLCKSTSRKITRSCKPVEFLFVHNLFCCQTRILS
jgi:hypothetical protein